MKITDIQIERYGVWQHLALPLQSAGLNVFYGPNEAGKTTLLRFIRDVLYRSLPVTGREKPLPNKWNGALRIAHAGRFCEVKRWTEQDGSTSAEFQDLDPALAWNTEPEWAIANSSEFESSTKEGTTAEASLEEILAHTDSQLFRNVFAIGLNELQELATLHDEEVAQHIYGLSLGLEGRKLLQICGQFQRTQQQQPGFPSTVADQIANLMQRDEKLQRELDDHRDPRDRHRQLLNEQSQLESHLQTFQARKAELEQQLNGHQTLKRVWEPWNQVREYEAQLRTLPLATEASQVDPSQLDQIENQHRQHSQQRKNVLAEIKQVRKQIQSARTHAKEQEFATEMQGFLNQRGWVVDMEREVNLYSARARELKTEFEARQQALGSEWPIHRLTAIDTSREAYARLVDGAHAFQLAGEQQATLRKRYDKYAAACHRRQAELDQHIEQLPEQSVKAALELTRDQLARVDELTQLKLKERELEQRLASQKREQERLQDRSQIPTWVPGFLLFLAASGLILSALGFYTSLTSNGITGLILGLVGIAGFAIARGFQLQTEGSVEEEYNSLQSTIRQHEKALNDVRSSIKKQTPKAWVVTVTDAELGEDSLENVLTTKLSGRISNLKQLGNRQRRMRLRRRKLSRMRKTMQSRAREVAQARQAWCELLTQCGLDESVEVDQAFGLWQQITDAMEQMRAWDTARESEAEVLGRYEAFCHRLADFGHRTGHGHLDYNHPLPVLDLWQEELATAGGESQELLAFKRELRDKKAKANRLKQQILKLRTERTVLLARVGATNREEFEKRRHSVNRRQELQELLELAKEELATANRHNTELAIVEEDLQTYNALQTQESIDLITIELDDLQSQFGDSAKRLENIKQERELLESDNRLEAIRAEREDISSQLRDCLEQQVAVEWSAKTVQLIRGQFERKCQPELLDIASDYLSQLTCGKYVKIWTRLGEQCLRLTDEDQQTFTVEQMSNGTREQLFLALRLGLVHEFANRGIELPMVLDDVLVNFDQYRTEAAIHTLIEFAERGHQVLLFTSHLHLARLCESQGIDPVWLPAHHATIEHRRAG